MKKHILTLICSCLPFNTFAGNLHLTEREKIVANVAFDGAYLCFNTSMTANYTQQSKKLGTPKSELLSGVSDPQQKKIISTAYDANVTNIELYTEEVFEICIKRLREGLVN